jgi:hypothetical protein
LILGEEELVSALDGIAREAARTWEVEQGILRSAR